MTVIYAINVTGKRSQPFFIMAAALVKEKHLDDSLPDNTVFATSDSGYRSDRLTYQCLQFSTDFCPLKRKVVGGY